MVLSISVSNIGILWIAIEATTLASAFLVGFHNDKHAIEAAWKYVIICSVGIAIALMGIIFLHLASIDVIAKTQSLQWPVLYAAAGELNPGILRLAFIFMLIGFGTKAGLAPMHTWLPDAHSQAPSPISALLSGVLLNSAMYAIIRIVAIVNKNLADSLFTGRVLIAFGLLSVLTAAIFILTQKDYKRLLAYSSIEHMGIIAIALGIFTPVSLFAAIFHMINHSFTKSMLFLASGNILQKYGTREIGKIRSLLKVMPLTGTAFLLGLFAISGAPPFSVFASELSVMTAMFTDGRFILGAGFIILLALIFAGIAVTLFRVFHEEPVADDTIDPLVNIPGTVAIMVLLVVISVMGLYMPDTLKALITNAQQLISGGS
jgi:hydrogenase-4 component F